MKPYLLKETHWKTVKETSYEIAVLPWGATEAHNYHLPYGTDLIQAEYFSEKSAEKAWEKGVKIVALPAVPFGVNTTQTDIPLTINMNPTTQLAVLTDVVDSLEAAGIKKLVIMNAHGGNDFKWMVRELYTSYPGFFICQMNWYLSVPWEKYFEDLGDHGGECETSIMMSIVPGLVLPLNEAGDGHAKKMKFSAKAEGWVWAPREWIKVTNDTGIGNPSKATKNKGDEFVEEAINKMADFFVELNNVDANDLYE